MCHSHLLTWKKHAEPQYKELLRCRKATEPQTITLNDVSINRAANEQLVGHKKL